MTDQTQITSPGDLRHLTDEQLSRAVDTVLDALQSTGVATVGDGTAILGEALARVLASAPRPDRERLSTALLAALPDLIRRGGEIADDLRALRAAAPRGHA